MKIYQLFLLIFLSLSLNACFISDTAAPVSVAQPQFPTAPVNYTVRKSETLYSIAWRYGLDYEEIAAWNHIKAPYQIHTGQEIRLRAPVAEKKAPVKSAPKRMVVKPKAKPKSRKTRTTYKKYRHTSGKIRWSWPLKGRIVAKYGSDGGLNKGIDIQGRVGQAVLASASGEVVYSGNGIRGYGNLLIIKNSSSYLSAYGYCQRLLVRTGDWVKQGQKIATVGSHGPRQGILHFEIRNHGKPLNPLVLLQTR